MPSRNVFYSHGRLTKTNRENELLQKQLDDLGRQVQPLLKETARRQDPTIPSDEELEADESMAPVGNIDEVITNTGTSYCPSITGTEIKRCSVSVREMGAKITRKSKARLCAKRMKLLSHCKNNWKHSVKIQVFTRDGDLMPATLRHRRVALLKLQTRLNGDSEA